MSELAAPLPDERLEEIANGAKIENAAQQYLLDEMQSMAHELLRRRDRDRRDSRTAEQVRKARWTVENALTKLDRILEVERAP